MLNDEQVATAPILILGNKIDKQNAFSEDHLKYYLGITQMTTGKQQISRSELSSRPIEVFMCSVLRRQGERSKFNDKNGVYFRLRRRIPLVESIFGLMWIMRIKLVYFIQDKVF